MLLVQAAVLRGSQVIIELKYFIKLADVGVAHLLDDLIDAVI